jgi:hypothetical protein
MAKKLNVRKLPQRERRESLHKFLEALAAHPDLAHFRTCVPGAPERQLALFAALERATFRGNAATAPPAHDDFPDQLLCDILDCIDRDPELSSLGSAYGPDRYQANLQALGVWTGRPHAIELFTTAISHLTASQTTTYLLLEPNYSPAPQITARFGDLIALQSAKSQANCDLRAGIIHQQGQTPGEKRTSRIDRPVTRPKSVAERLDPSAARGKRGLDYGRFCRRGSGRGVGPSR